MIAAAYHGGRMHEFRNILGHTRIWIVALTLPLFLVMIAFPQMILSMFGDDYVEGAWILRILATGQFVNAVAGPLGLTFSMTDRQKILAAVMLLAGVLKVVLNFVAIPVWEAIGAATVTMLCLLLINITLLMIIHRSIFSVFTSTSDPLYDQNN
jgi:O-antigen/teichoic acid export membrane protein